MRPSIELVDLSLSPRCAHQFVDYQAMHRPQVLGGCEELLVGHTLAPSLYPLVEDAPSSRVARRCESRVTGANDLHALVTRTAGDTCASGLPPPRCHLTVPGVGQELGDLALTHVEVTLAVCLTVCDDRGTGLDRTADLSEVRRYAATPVALGGDEHHVVRCVLAGVGAVAPGLGVLGCGRALRPTTDELCRLVGLRLVLLGVGAAGAEVNPAGPTGLCLGFWGFLRCHLRGSLGVTDLGDSPQRGVRVVLGDALSGYSCGQLLRHAHTLRYGEFRAQDRQGSTPPQLRGLDCFLGGEVISAELVAVQDLEHRQDEVHAAQQTAALSGAHSGTQAGLDHGEAFDGATQGTGGLDDFLAFGHRGQGLDDLSRITVGVGVGAHHALGARQVGVRFEALHTGAVALVGEDFVVRAYFILLGEVQGRPAHAAGLGFRCACELVEARAIRTGQGDLSRRLECSLLLPLSEITSGDRPVLQRRINTVPFRKLTKVLHALLECGEAYQPVALRVGERTTAHHGVEWHPRVGRVVDGASVFASVDGVLVLGDTSLGALTGTGVGFSGAVDVLCLPGLRGAVFQRLQCGFFPRSDVRECWAEHLALPSLAQLFSTLLGARLAPSVTLALGRGSEAQAGRDTVGEGLDLALHVQLRGHLLAHEAAVHHGGDARHQVGDVLVVGVVVAEVTLLGELLFSEALLAAPLHQVIGTDVRGLVFALHTAGERDDVVLVEEFGLILVGHAGQIDDLLGRADHLVQLVQVDAVAHTVAWALSRDHEALLEELLGGLGQLLAPADGQAILLALLGRGHGVEHVLGGVHSLQAHRLELRLGVLRLAAALVVCGFLKEVVAVCSDDTPRLHAVLGHHVPSGAGSDLVRVGAALHLAAQVGDAVLDGVPAVEQLLPLLEQPGALDFAGVAILGAGEHVHATALGHGRADLVERHHHAACAALDLLAAHALVVVRWAVVGTHLAVIVDVKLLTDLRRRVGEGGGLFEGLLLAGGDCLLVEFSQEVVHRRRAEQAVQFSAGVARGGAIGELLQQPDEVVSVLAPDVDALVEQEVLALRRHQTGQLAGQLLPLLLGLNASRWGLQSLDLSLHVLGGGGEVLVAVLTHDAGDRVSHLHRVFSAVQAAHGVSHAAQAGVTGTRLGARHIAAAEVAGRVDQLKRGVAGHAGQTLLALVLRAGELSSLPCSEVHA